MSVTATVPGKLPTTLAGVAFDWVTDTFKCGLLTSLASYNQDTTTVWSDLSASEVANANGYTTGGNTVGSKSLTYNATGNKNQYKGSIPAWTSSGAGFSAVGAVIYRSTGGAIVAVIDFGGTQTATNGGTFTITTDATDGIFYAAPA